MKGSTVGNTLFSGTVKSDAIETKSVKATTVEGTTSMTTPYFTAAVVEAGSSNVGDAIATKLTVNGDMTVGGTATYAGSLGVNNLTVTSLTCNGAATIKGTSTVPQILQTTPAFLMQSFANQNVLGGTEVSAKFLQTPYKTQGATNLSYQSSTGLFTNNTAVPRMYLVSYTMYFTGLSGGRRGAYIRLSTGNVDNYPPGQTGADQDSQVNTAYSYAVGVDTGAIKLTGCAPILVGAGGTFAVYLFQNGTGSTVPLAVSGHVLIHSF